MLPVVKIGSLRPGQQTEVMRLLSKVFHRGYFSLDRQWQEENTLFAQR
jgi:hypothetical protein